MEITALPVSLLRFPIQEIKKIIFYHQTYNEYYRLKKEYAGLKNRMIGVEEIAQENNRLVRLLEFKRNLVFSSVAAVVIGRDPTDWNDSLVINKGKNQGLAVGMPVISSGGIVGKIAEVGQTTSRVILLTDPNFSVAALIQRTRESGLLTGTLRGLCRMHYLMEDSQIKIGDKVITSKLSSSFPEGLLIGEVVSIEQYQEGSAVECLVRPAVNLSQIEEVVVVKNHE